MRVPFTHKRQCSTAFPPVTHSVPTMTGVAPVEQIGKSSVQPHRCGAIKDLNVRPPVRANKNPASFLLGLGGVRKVLDRADYGVRHFN